MVQTWPLVLHTTDRIADSTSAPLPDIYYSLWNLDWVKRAILDLQTNPYHTDFLFFPQGEDLYLHPLTLINAILSIPLQLATDNLFLSWNILALLLFVLSGLAMYAVAYRVTGNQLAAVVAGFMFAFAPVVMMQFNGRWNISTVWPIPLFVLFLLRFLESGRLKEAALAGVVWAALMYNNQEFALDATLFLGLFLAYWTVVYVRQKDRQRLLGLWRGGAIVTVVWLAVGAPLIIGAWIDARSGEYVLAAQDEYYSADLLSYFTPSPAWGPGKHPTSFNAVHDRIGSIENTLYLGGVALILAALAFFSIRRNPHRVLFWAMVFLVFAILALGPYLYVDGVKRSSFPLPYQVYDQLPLFGDRRVPARMLPFGMVGLCALAAVGFDFLMSWLRQNYRLLAPVAAVLIMSLVALEYWNPPVHLSALPRPAILEQIREEPGDFAVLDAPLGRRDGWLHNGHFEGANVSDYYAFLHGKRAFGGFVGRMKDTSRAWLREEPGLRYLAFPFEPPLQEDFNSEMVQEVFRKYRIKYVVLYRIGPHGQPIDAPSQLDALDGYLREVVGLTPIANEPSLSVYRNQQVH